MLGSVGSICALKNFGDVSITVVDSVYESIYESQDVRVTRLD